MTLNLYIIRNIFTSFLITTFVIAGIILLDRVRWLLPFLKITDFQLIYMLKMLFYSFPTVLFNTLPISLFIGVYIAVHRMSQDSEVIILRSFGLSLSIFIKSILCITIPLSIFLALITLWINPYSIQKLSQIKFDLIKNHTQVNLQPARMNKIGDKLFYIFQKEEDVYKGILISDFKNPATEEMIEAETGRIYFDAKEQKVLLLLNQGKIHFPVTKKGEYSFVTFEHFKYPISIEEIVTPGIEKKYKQVDQNLENKIDQELVLNELIEEMKKLKDLDKKSYNSIHSELYQRFFPSISCIFLALVAFPIGISFHRKQNAMDKIKLIAVFIINYTLYTQGVLLADRGVHPLIMYLPCVFLMVLGMIGFLKANYDFNEYHTISLVRTFLKNCFFSFNNKE